MPAPRKTSVWVAIHCPGTGRVLLARRAAGTRNPGQWNLFGGGVDDGETPRQAAVRELREEGGFVVERRRLASIGDASMGRKRLRLFLTNVHAEFAPCLNAESDAWEWVPATALLEWEGLHAQTALFAPKLAALLAPLDANSDAPITIPEPAAPGWWGKVRRRAAAWVRGFSPVRSLSS